MTAWKLIVVAVALVACAVALTSAQSQLSSAPRVLGCPGAPWCPVWVNCSYTDAPGASCHDCSTIVICTEAGGLLQPCLLPWMQHCANGQCRPTPSTECATEAPTKAPTEAPTEAATQATSAAPAEDPDTAPEDASAP